MKFKRRLREELGINLTPLIDVVFLLLIFFMVTTTFTRETRLAVNLPQAYFAVPAFPQADGEPLEDSPDRIEVLVSQGGGYSINGRQLVNARLETLMAGLDEVSAGDRSIPLLLIADAEASHQAVVTAMDAIGQSGFSSLSIATRKSDEEEADVVQLAWGLTESSARFVVEYTYQTSDFTGFDLEYTKHALTYSGYWTPDLHLPELYRYLPRVHGVLGAGVGVSNLTLKSSAEEIGDDFSDRGLQLKVAAGLEYRITRNLAITATYEHHFNETYKDWVAENHEIVFDEGDQQGFVISVSGWFN